MMSYKDMGSGRSGIEEGRKEEGRELDGDKRGETGVEIKKKRQFGKGKDGRGRWRRVEEEWKSWMEGWRYK